MFIQQSKDVGTVNSNEEEETKLINLVKSRNFTMILLFKAAGIKKIQVYKKQYHWLTVKTQNYAVQFVENFLLQEYTPRKVYIFHKNGSQLKLMHVVIQEKKTCL